MLVQYQSLYLYKQMALQLLLTDFNKVNTKTTPNIKTNINLQIKLVNKPQNISQLTTNFKQILKWKK